MNGPRVDEHARRIREYNLITVHPGLSVVTYKRPKLIERENTLRRSRLRELSVMAAAPLRILDSKIRIFSVRKESV
jgi:hypothetical protein